jgi:hypothetical protein
MAKITRANQKIFASNAGLNQRGKIGSLAAGAPVTTTDPEVMQELANYETGMFGIVLGNNSAAIEEINSLHFLATRQLAYLYQQGIAEWNEDTTYYIGSMVNDGGEIYVSLTDDNLNNLVSDITKWAPFFEYLYTTKGSLLTANGTKNVLLPASTNGYVLTSQSSEASGLKWFDYDDKLKFMAATNLSVGSVPSADYNGLAYGKTSAGVAYWVAVSAGTGTARSFDGTTFTAGGTAPSSGWNSVAFGLDLFVAVADTGTGNRVMTSPTGLTWTARTTPADNAWNEVCFGNNIFVAVASSGTGNRVMTSTNGTTWTIRTSAADNAWQSVVWGNGLFVAVANSGTGNRVMTSPNGTAWTIRTSAADVGWRSVTFGNGVFVAVAAAAVSNNVMTSPDGINWTIQNMNIPSGPRSFFSITFGNGFFVATSGTASDIWAISRDGITWIEVAVPSIQAWTSVAYGEGRFVCMDATAGTLCCYSQRYDSNLYSLI